MTRSESLDYLKRTREMGLSDLCMEAEEHAIEALENNIKYRKKAKKWKRKYFELKAKVEFQEWYKAIRSIELQGAEYEGKRINE